jgi:hypothetical protein
MSKKRVNKQTSFEKLKSLELHQFWISAVSGIMGVAVSLLGLVISVVSESKSAIHSSNALTYFVIGIFSLAVTVVGIASFMRRKNRGTLLLKQRLSEIYLTALRSSAFNPQLSSQISDE